MDIVDTETDKEHALGSEDSHDLVETGGVGIADEFVLSQLGENVEREVGFE